VTLPDGDTALLVTRYNDVRARFADELLDDMAAGPRPAELNEALALPLATKVICLLLGVPADDQFQCSMDGFLSFSKMRPKEAMRWQQELWKYIGDFIESKRTDPGSDLVSDLIRVARSVGSWRASPRFRSSGENRKCRCASWRPVTPVRSAVYASIASLRSSARTTTAAL
jgi:hypothetical protein